MITKSIGIISKQLTSCKDYKLHGKYIRWYVNGNMNREWWYKDGGFNGKHASWNFNGDKIYECEYKDGKRIW